jgi:uncharacterized membrane protein
VHTVESNLRRNQRTNRALVVINLLAAFILVVGGLILYAKIDAKVSHADATVTEIRATQETNTSVSLCQRQDFDQVLEELFKQETIQAPPRC